MATDATGTPTSLGIPKYNTSVDAPSGLGFNAAMDEINDILSYDFVPSPGSPVAGNGLVWDGDSWEAAFPPGFEFDYKEVTTAQVEITPTTEGTATGYVTSNSKTFDGSTAVLIDFWAPFVQTGTSNIKAGLWDDGLSVLGIMQSSTTPLTSGFSIRRRITPTAAAHTFSVKFWVDGGSGWVYAGAGGSGVNLPAFLRVTKV